jgi:hypothetical protein
MENEHRPRALADDEVALPMTGLGPGVDVLWPLVDGNAILDKLRNDSTSMEVDHAGGLAG